MSLEAAERAIREGDLGSALQKLQEQIRARPSDAELRVFLFQLLCVMGQWERAQTQLQLAADLDAGALAMAQMYREAIRCEMLRSEVFAGRKSPVVFGEPAEWIALLVESLANATNTAHAQGLRERAFDAAPASAGSIDGQPFEWIADADMRLGPICEAIINGQYYWVPFERISRIDLEPPADLRDVVWMPALFQFANGGEAVGIIPTRYPGSQDSDDAQVCLARKTLWIEGPAEVFAGVGQRVLTTDAGEHALMDIRSIAIGDAARDPAQPATHA